MSNGIGAFEKFQLRAHPIQTEEAKEVQSMAEKLADPNSDLLSDEIFNAVNLISEEYLPKTKNNVTAKQAQVGTTFFDLAVANQKAREAGVLTPRTDSGFLGRFQENNPEQFYGEEQFDLNTFKGLINRGFITTKDGTPINIQSGPLETRTVESDPYYATYQEYLIWY